MENSGMWLVGLWIKPVFSGKTNFDILIFFFSSACYKACIKLVMELH